MTSEIREAVGLVERCFAAIAAHDADGLVENYAENYVLELPYYKPDEPLVLSGRPVVHAYLRTLLAAQHMEIVLTGHHWVPSERLLIAEYESRGHFLDNGEPYRNRYVGYWYIEDGVVVRLREYYNPEAPRASAVEAERRERSGSNA